MQGSRMVQWEEELKRLLRRGKVYAAAALSSQGELLDSVPEIKIAPAEGESLAKATISNYNCVFKLKFNGTVFTCFHKGKHTLVGCAEETVLVSEKVHDDVLIVGLAHADSPGSCLYEITEFARLMNKNNFRPRVITTDMNCNSKTDTVPVAANA